MEFMEILKMVSYLVWIMVGVTIIATTIYYIAISYPIIKQQKNFMKDLYSGRDEA